MADERFVYTQQYEIDSLAKEAPDTPRTNEIIGNYYWNETLGAEDETRDLIEPFRKMERELLSHEAKPVAQPHEGLMRFYSVASVDELIDAMAHHIDKLQAKVPPLRDEQPRSPRA